MAILWLVLNNFINSNPRFKINIESRCYNENTIYSNSNRLNGHSGNDV